MKDDDVQSMLDERLRALGMTDDEIRSVEAAAHAIKDARDKALDELRQEKGDGVFFVAEVMQRMYGVMTAMAQLGALVDEKDKDRSSAIYATALKITSDILYMLQRQFGVSDEDMKDLVSFGEAVVNQILQQSEARVKEMNDARRAA